MKAANFFAILLFFLIYTSSATITYANMKPYFEGALGLKWGDLESTVSQNAKSRNWLLDDTTEIDMSDLPIQKSSKKQTPQLIRTLHYKGIVAEENAQIALYFDRTDSTLFTLHAIIVFFRDMPESFRAIHFHLLFDDFVVKHGKPDKTSGIPNGEFQWAIWYLPTTGKSKTKICLENTRSGYTLSYSIYRSNFGDL
jgi:hypothetical protein